MAATITTSIVTGGTNSHATTSAEANAVATDFVAAGVNGGITNTSGIAPTTGSFAVNAQGTPAMFVDVTAGTAWITATPSGQTSQLLRASMASNYTSYAISSNASGSTKYDWIYLKVDPTKGNNPASDASDVTSLFTSRSSSNSTDNGSPPTYGILLAVVTVANGASSITNSNITDGRSQSYMASSGDNGTSLQQIRSENTFDFVASGCVWTADSAGSTLNGSMTAGVVYIGGKRVTVSLVTAHAFTASKDTYVDVDNTGTLHYTEATNNAASAALTSGYLRLAIVVTGASSIAAAASINQGQQDRVLPIASSIAYSVSDSLGNLICPRDPQRRILGGALMAADYTITSSSMTDVTGVQTTINVPTGRKVRLSFQCRGTDQGTSGSNNTIAIRESSTVLAEQITLQTGQQLPVNIFTLLTPSAGVHTYKVSFQPSTAATASHLYQGVGSMLLAELV